MSFISSPPTILLRGSVATTSGNPIDVTGLPSNASRIVLGWGGVSTNGTQPVGIQIGDSGGIETSAYVGTCLDLATNYQYSTGFFDATASAAIVRQGFASLELINPSTNLWSYSFTEGFSNSASGRIHGGNKALSATLDRFRLTTLSGADAFDAGSLTYTVWG